MDPRRFDDWTRSLPTVSRRRALPLLGAVVVGGLAGPLGRRGAPLVAQEPAGAPAATPGGDVAVSPEGEAPAVPTLPEPAIVDRIAGEDGPFAPEDETPAAPLEPTPEAGMATDYVLTGGPDPAEPIRVDDDLLLLLNETPIFVDEDGGTNVLAPIPFQAATGDRLIVVARDASACGRQIGALWLHRADGGEPRFLTAGQNLGCDEAAQIPQTFYRDSWRI